MKRAEVILADDHPIVLDGLRRLFESEPGWIVTATCRDGESTLLAVQDAPPDVLVLDLHMPGMNGIEVIRGIGEVGLALPIVVLTAGLSDNDLVEVVRLGVRGLVLKDQVPRKLLECARTVVEGGSCIDDEVTGALLRRASGSQPAVDELTSREMEVAWLATTGLRSREISARLGIAEGTVKIHLHKVYQKLGVSNRVELNNRLRETERRPETQGGPL